MAEKTIGMTFDGYWRDKNKGKMPNSTGVYCVYECTHNLHKNTVGIHNLIYVGESDIVNSRIANHEKYNDWLRHVRQGNELCFSFGSIGSSDRNRAEAAIIFKHQPPENVEYKDSFVFDKTTMLLSGKIALLLGSFTVRRT